MQTDGKNLEVNEQIVYVENIFDVAYAYVVYVLYT